MPGTTISTRDQLIENIAEAFNALSETDILHAEFDPTDFLATVETYHDSLSPEVQAALVQFTEGEFDLFDITDEHGTAALDVVIIDLARYMARATTFREVSARMNELSGHIGDLITFASHYDVESFGFKR
jgi:hypothetical protein